MLFIRARLVLAASNKMARRTIKTAGLPFVVGFSARFFLPLGLHQAFERERATRRSSSLRLIGIKSSRMCNRDTARYTATAGDNGF